MIERALCYLCAFFPVPAAVIVVKHLYGAEERRPGICDQCRRAHLEGGAK